MENGKSSKYFRHSKAVVLDTYKFNEINDTIKQFFNEECIVFTDKSKPYADIADFVELHIMENLQCRSPKNFEMGPYRHK